MKLRFSNRASSPPTSRKTTNDRPASHRKTTNDSSGGQLLVQHYLTTWFVFNKAGFSTNEIRCGFLCPGLVAILGLLKVERPND